MGGRVALIRGGRLYARLVIGGSVADWRERERERAAVRDWEWGRKKGGRGIGLFVWRCLLGCGGRDGGGFFGANDMGKKMERVEGKGRFVNRWIAPSWWRGWRVWWSATSPQHRDGSITRQEGKPTAAPRAVLQVLISAIFSPLLITVPVIINNISNNSNRGNKRARISRCPNKEINKMRYCGGGCWWWWCSEGGDRGTGGRVAARVRGRWAAVRVERRYSNR